MRSIAPSDSGRCTVRAIGVVAVLVGSSAALNSSLRILSGGCKTMTRQGIAAGMAGVIAVVVRFIYSATVTGLGLLLATGTDCITMPQHH